MNSVSDKSEEESLDVEENDAQSQIEQGET